MTEKKPLTLQNLRALLKDLGCTLRVRDGELRVNLKGYSEATAYYTDDRHDALATAEHMAQERDLNRKVPQL